MKSAISIRRKLLVTFLTAVLVPLFIFVYFQSLNAEKYIKEDVFQNIEALAIEKYNNIETYALNIKRGLEFLGQYRRLVEAKAVVQEAFYLHGVASPDYEKAESLLRPISKNIIAIYQYYDIFIMSLSGDVIFSYTHEDDFNTNLFSGPYSDSGLAEVTNSIIRGEAFAIAADDYYLPSKSAAIFAATPLIDNNKVVGVIAIQTTTEQIDQVINDFIGLGDTGETVVAEMTDNGPISVAPLRHIPDSAFKFLLSAEHTLPIDLAINQESGIDYSLDYRNKEVIAAWRYLPVFDWGMVVKIDTDEAFYHVSELNKNSAVLVAIVCISAIVFSIIISSRISNRIIQMNNVARTIGKGEFLEKADESGNDEISELAKSINWMRSEIKNTHQQLSKNIDALETSNTALEEHAFYDNLTKLPNRALLEEKVKSAISICERNKSNGAILFIDLDNFKSINDSLGHNIGDEILKNVANKLNQSLRDCDDVARIGGDEFIVLLADLGIGEVEAQIKAKQVAQKIAKTISKQTNIEELALYITCSIGIAMFPDGNKSYKELFRYSDTAMYEAKSTGKNSICFFKNEMEEQAHSRLEIENEIRAAIDRNEFSLNYQPQVSIRDGEIFGAEALLRWNNEKLGFVSPSVFIPIAEQSNLIIEVDDWVLKNAFEFISRCPNLPIISINVCAKQFSRTDFVPKISKLINEYGVEPSKIDLELTETAIVTNKIRTLESMRALKKLGVRLSLDDYGTGFSSLSYLRDLPFDTVKLDRSFIQDIDINQADVAILEATLVLAKGLNLNVIAEGVETTLHRDILVSKKCFNAQGFYFSKPVNENELLKLIGKKLG